MLTDLRATPTKKSVYVPRSVFQKVESLTEKLKEEAPPLVCQWPIFKNESLACSFVHTLLPGSQETSTFLQFSSRIPNQRLHGDQIAGIKYEMGSRSHVLKSQVVPYLVPPDTKVTNNRGEEYTVSKYTLNEGNLKAHLISDSKDSISISIPSEEEYFVSVKPFRRLSTAYFGTLTHAYFLHQFEETILVLVPASQKWQTLTDKGVVVSDVHNSNLNDMSTQILTFPSVAVLSTVFAMVKVTSFLFCVLIFLIFQMLHQGTSKFPITVKVKVEKLFKPVATAAIESLNDSFPALGDQIALAQEAFDKWQRQPTDGNYRMYQSIISGLVSTFITDMTGKEVVHDGLFITQEPEPEKEAKKQDKARVTQKKEKKKDAKQDDRTPFRFLMDEYTSMNSNLGTLLASVLEKSKNKMGDLDFPKEAFTNANSWTILLVSVAIDDPKEAYDLLSRSLSLVSLPQLLKLKEFHEAMKGEVRSISKQASRSALESKARQKVEDLKRENNDSDSDRGRFFELVDHAGVEAEDLDNPELRDSLEEMSNGHGNDDFHAIKEGAKSLSNLRLIHTANQESARSLRGSSKRKVNLFFMN